MNVSEILTHIIIGIESIKCIVSVVIEYFDDISIIYTLIVIINS